MIKIPLPKPKPNEKKKDFIERCVTSDIMRKEYPNVKQRVAVCHSIWKREKKK